MYFSKLFHKPGKLLYKLLILALFIFTGNQQLLAQRFNFTQYNIEHGLIQSQVRAFAQSPSRHLWIATHGGVSRFDGTQFYSLTRSENGLAGMMVTALATDRKGRLYIGTTNGLSLFDGKRVRNFQLPAGKENSKIYNLLKDKSERIIAKINHQLYLFTGDSFRLLRISGTAKDSVMAITSDSEGAILAAVYGKGIYKMEGDSWKLHVALADFPGSMRIQQIVADRTNKDKIWIVTPKKLFFTGKSQLVPYENSLLDSGNNFLISLAQDEKSNLWVGTYSGAFYVEPHKTTYFHSRNGFTDNAVNRIFRDAENNIWFATEGAGIYKYDGDKTMVVDKGQGLSNEIVMSFAKDRSGNVWMSSFGNSLVKLQDGEIVDIKLPIPDSISYGINCLFNDKDGNIWIGTSGAGLLKYDGQQFYRFPYQPDKVPKVIGHIMQDRFGAIWLGTPTGCYTIKDGKFAHVENSKGMVKGLLEIGKDSVLISTEDSIFLISGKNHRVELIPKKEVQRTMMYCMAKYKNLVLFGTGENGIWIWDLNKNGFRNITKKNGLYSNTIYSLIADKKGTLWVGTGRGINKIRLNTSTDKFEVSGAEYSQRMIVECNQNAMFFHQNKLWVGTTKGALIFERESGNVKNEKPHIVLQSVKLFSSDVKARKESFSTADGSHLPRDLTLAFRRNHVNINFKGIYLTNPAEVLYQYRLRGLDDTFSIPTTNASVNYQTLPPGNYVFEARAMNKAGLVSDNMLRFPFSIRPAFYQTLAFKLAVILFLILSGIGLQAYLHNLKNQRLRLIENLKREERLKARQQTAEDFHDDLGNKLTRISILSDILNTKLNGEHQEEKQLITQIKENASSLYRGTKDILWALDPKSDNLYEILSHISEFGIELFHDTPTEINFEGIKPSLENIKFPMEYSRNICMIFKESLNNILRHAEARHVTLMVMDYERSIEINLKDDGKGFNPAQAHRGLGLNNVYMRSKRIGAKIDISTSRGSGTNLTLLINKN